MRSEGKRVTVLCQTSNGGYLISNFNVDGTPLYRVVARLAVEEWSGQLGLVKQPKFSSGIVVVRLIAGDMLLLNRGIGGQGGTVRVTVRAARFALGGRRNLDQFFAGDYLYEQR